MHMHASGTGDSAVPKAIGYSQSCKDAHKERRKERRKGKEQKGHKSREVNQTTVALRIHSKAIIANAQKVLSQTLIIGSHLKPRYTRPSRQRWELQVYASKKNN